MIWNITEGKFKDFSFSVAVKDGAITGVQDHDKKTERKLQESEKPKIDGADVEDFGRKARTFSATIVFFGNDYRDRVVEFDKILNEGTSGILTLPDLQEAYNAKVKSIGQKSSSTDGNSTMFTVEWLEDNAVSVPKLNRAEEILNAQENIKNGNTEEVIPTAQSFASKTNEYADKSRSLLNNNKFLNDARKSLASSSAVTTGVNGILGVPKSARDQLVALSDQAGGTNDELKSGITGFLGFLDGLKGKSNTSAAAGVEFAPTRFNTTDTASDFMEPDIVTSAVVSGSQQIVKTTVTEVKIDSFKEAITYFKAKIKEIETNNVQLEDLSRGQTAEYRTSTIFIINSLKDLISIIDDSPSKYVFSSIDSSLIEIMFANGIFIDQLERVHKLNRHLFDIIDISANTVVGL